MKGLPGAPSGHRREHRRQRSESHRTGRRCRRELKQPKPMEREAGSIAAAGTCSGNEYDRAQRCRSVHGTRVLYRSGRSRGTGRFASIAQPSSTAATEPANSNGRRIMPWAGGRRISRRGHSGGPAARSRWYMNTANLGTVRCCFRSVLQAFRYIALSRLGQCLNDGVKRR